MDSRNYDQLDCKIPVRKYVLIAQPTRWCQQGDRVVVQSPMLNIGTSISHVPVKCCHGEGQNDVGFLPKSDIEKDTKDVYEKSHVSRVTSSVNAHGVAAFDSVSSDDFEYKRGHHFWIFVGQNTVDYKNIVPVVNLDTYQSGIIRIDQVRWIPNTKGPGRELWTLGGRIKLQKLSGSKKFRSWSWVICQYSDGKPPTTKDVEIPTEDISLADRSLLSIQESQTLFNVQCKVMEDNAMNSQLPTPPPSPEPTLISENLKLWQRILRVAEERRRRRGATYALRISTVHTTHIESNRREKYEELNSIGPVFPIATSFWEMHKNDVQTPVSLTNPVMRRNPTAAIQEYQIEHRPEHNVLLRNLCDLNDTKCPYISKLTAKHFHSPPEKCRRVVFDEAPPHECCISTLGPFPHAGACLLANSPRSYPNHECCKWDPVDTEGITVKIEQEENVKVSEARMNRVKLKDMSSSVAGLYGGGRSFAASLENGSLDKQVKELPALGHNIRDEFEDWNKVFNEIGFR